MDEIEQTQLEPMSRNKRLSLIGFAVVGTILFSLFCISYINALIENVGVLTNLTAVKALTYMEYTVLIIDTGSMMGAISLTGMIALIAWVVIFIEFGYDKKYANYLSVIPIVGGIICIWGMNGFPNGDLTGIIISAVGGAILLTGVACKMGLFGKPPSVKQE